MVVQFSSILEPDDFGPGFSRGHTNEHNLVAEDILIVEMRCLCNSSTLTNRRKILILLIALKCIKFHLFSPKNILNI